ncbi:MAG: PHP domain-containing protein, partial [Gemmatimonadaceae bacterium]
MGFIELRAHTAFSFGDGSVSPEALAARAASLGYSAIGITDTADLGGIVRFGLEARRQGIRPIVGAELNIDGCPAAFLARSKEGFNNLASLVTRSRVGELSSWKKGDGKKTRGRPRIAWQQVAERSEGLQVLTGPASGSVAS